MWTLWFSLSAQPHCSPACARATSLGCFCEGFWWPRCTVLSQLQKLLVFLSSWLQQHPLLLALFTDSPISPLRAEQSQSSSPTSCLLPPCTVPRAGFHLSPSFSLHSRNAHFHRWALPALASSLGSRNLLHGREVNWPHVHFLKSGFP